MSRRLKRNSLLVSALVFAITSASPASPQPASPTGQAASKLREILDWSSLVIAVQHQGCFGGCPVYRLQVHGDGTVVYEGRLGTPPYAFVAVPGRHTDRVSLEAVQDLFRRVLTTDFQTDRPIRVPDAPQAQVGVAYDAINVLKQATTPSLWDLINEVDRIAGVERWTIGNADTVPSLKREKWSFRSYDEDNLAIVPGVARFADVSVLKSVLAEGAPVRRSASLSGCKAILYALEKRVDRGRSESVLELLRRGASPQWQKLPGSTSRSNDWNHCDALSQASAFGLADIVEILLKRNANPNFVNEDALSTPLLVMASQSGDCSRGDYPRVAQLLIAAGADVNGLRGRGSPPIMVVRCPEVARILIMAGASVRANRGGTPLMHVLARIPEARSQELIRVFLDGGVDVNAQNEDGNTALMQNYVTPEAARILIAAGADVNALNSRDQTALSRTRSPELTQVFLELGADPRIPYGTLHPLLQSSCTPDQRRQAAGGRPIALQDQRCNSLTEWIAQHPD